jgi:6-phosphogluconolactonase (cycloisomerase 2 family)
MVRRRIVTSFAAALLLAAATPGAAAGEAAAAGPFVYVTNADSGTVSAFAVGKDGALTFIGATEPAKKDAKQDLRGIAVGKDGHTVYATDEEHDQVVVYRVGASGTLTAFATVPTGGVTPFGITVAPDGRSLYTANIDSNDVSRFPILLDGVLGSPQTVKTGATHPRGVAVSPDGRFVYVSHGTPMPPPAEPGVLTTMAVGPDGTLSPVGKQIRAGFSAAMIAIRPDGKFLYVGAQASDQVYGFRIGPDGGLVEVPHSPVDSDRVPEGIVMTPDGRHVYTADEHETEGNVRGFTVGADGSLTGIEPAVDQGHSHVGIAVTPDGRFVYSSNGTDNRVTGYAIGADGTLKQVADVSSYGLGSAFQSVAISPGVS